MFAISKSLERCSVVKDPAKVNIALDPVDLAAMGDRSQSEYTRAARTWTKLPDGIQSAVRQPPYTHPVSIP
jgi:hypothetical protein